MTTDTTCEYCKRAFAMAQSKGWTLAQWQRDLTHRQHTEQADVAWTVMGDPITEA